VSTKIQVTKKKIEGGGETGKKKDGSRMCGDDQSKPMQTNAGSLVKGNAELGGKKKRMSNKKREWSGLRSSLGVARGARTREKKKQDRGDRGSRGQEETGGRGRNPKKKGVTW